MPIRQTKQFIPRASRSIMSSENSATQSMNLPFSIENILKEDFPPKSRLAFPPKDYYLPAATPKESFAAPKVIRWMPLARYATFWPFYYRQFMYLPTYGVIPNLPMESKDDSEKQENMETCLDCKKSRCIEDESGQGDNHVHEQVEATTNDSTDHTDDHHQNEADKESQSRKRRSRSQFTPMQLKYLEKYYSNHSYLSRDERTVLAQALDMTELQIRNWFQNKRYHKKIKMQSKE